MILITIEPIYYMGPSRYDSNP